MASGRLVRLLVLLWLGWYLSGPICALVDFWDSPSEEMQDIAMQGGGALGLAAAAFGIGIALASKTRTLCKVVGRAARAIEAVLPDLQFPALAVSTTVPRGMSPPMPLRI